MEFKHDPEADAIYIYLSSRPHVYGRDLDDDRRIDYASDDSPIGVELLNVSKGINIDGLPCADEISVLLEKLGMRIYAPVLIKQPSPSKLVTVFEIPVSVGGITRTQTGRLLPQEDMGEMPWTLTSHSFVIMPK